MSKVTAESERVQVQYRGYFAEPVFAVLGNPAKLYSSLLRQFASFGAKIGDLSINLSVLAQANVSCFLPGAGAGMVRVSIDHLEVYLPNASSLKQAEHVLGRAFVMASETDDSLRPIRHEVTLHAWARLREEPFSSYVSRFVTMPQGSARWKPSIEFVELDADGTPAGLVRLEEASTIPEGLFVRAVVNLGSAAASDVISAFTVRLEAQLGALDLDLPLRIE